MGTQSRKMPAHRPQLHQAAPAPAHRHARIQRVNPQPSPRPAPPKSAPDTPSAPKYTKEKRLGEGAFGVCFRVKSDQGGTYAMKEVQLGSLPSREQKRAVEEVYVLRRLRHPGIIRCADAFIKNKALYIVMELATGGDLATHLKAGPVHQMTALPWIAQLASALHFLHEAKVIPRDLKPANILLSGARLKIADFGIASLQEHTLAMAFTRIGTLQY